MSGRGGHSPATDPDPRHPHLPGVVIHSARRVVLFVKLDVHGPHALQGLELGHDLLVREVGVVLALDLLDDHALQRFWNLVFGGGLSA